MARMVRVTDPMLKEALQPTTLGKLCMVYNIIV